MNSPKPGEETLLAEYGAAQADYLHNDNFPWQIGTILVAGTFIFWGILIDVRKEAMDLMLFGVASLLVTLLLSAWILFFHHYRQTARYKLDRLQEIEKELGMDSHLRWVSRDGKKARYKNYGFSGHVITLFVYFVAGVGGSVIGFLKSGFLVSHWFVWPIVAVAITVGMFLCQEKRLSDSLDL